MGGSSVVSGDSSDWEVIQNPTSHQPSSPPPQAQLHEYELIIRDNFFHDKSSIFPPNEHEDLPLVEDCMSPRITSPPQSPLSSACSDLITPTEQNTKSYLRPSIIINVIGTRMYTFGRSVFQIFQCSNSRYYSSLFPATVVAVALFACVKILQWRNQLLLLIREKDQKISQLLHHISHMNEILSARRKVPVLRIN